MVVTQLTPELMTEGALLVQGLDDNGRSPDAALWVYFSDINAWKLLLAEARVGKEGPRELYRAAQRVLHALQDQITHLSLDDVAVAKPNAPIVSLLSHALVTDRGIKGIRFTGNVINGTLVEDAYVYRLVRPST